VARAAVSWWWPFRRRKRKERIDPFTLTDPWRSFVQDAQQAEARFGRIVSSVEDGPLRDRLRDVEERVREGVGECWRIAQSGYRLQKMVREVSDSASEPVTRMRARTNETSDKLAALTKSLDEAVARAAELATGQYAGLDAVANDVEHVVTDLEALRQAIEEINAT
jgi:cell division septum initiation protein DivIVA